VSVALVIRYAKRMRCVTLSSVHCPTPPHFPTLSYKRHDFRRKVIEHKTCVLILYIYLSATFLILRRIQRDIIINNGFGGLGVACWPLVLKFAGSNPAEAVGFLGRKNPQHAFLRRGSKAVGPMS